MTNDGTTNGAGAEHSSIVIRHSAFTLVEMLVAMAITLVMMGAVVTLFANISHSVRNRRATIEMSSQLRHLRNVLQQDLQGATCPGVTWQRPESNHGYIEIIEGQYREGYATNLIDNDSNGPSVLNPEIDHKLSTIPSSNLPFADSTWATDGGGLGDFDDVLMLTVRNEREPFVGRAPTNVRLDDRTAEQFEVDDSLSRPAWGYESIQSPLAEVVWFAIEDPGHTDPAMVDDPTVNRFFGEPGMRTIYRRTLLIAPWLNPYRYTDKNGSVDTFTYDGASFKAQPGLMRILPRNIPLEEALAAIVAFQDRYDLSVRLEWDGDIQRWKIVANTLGDLTKRENRFGHFGYRWGPSNSQPPERLFPFAFQSMGANYSGNTQPVEFVSDREVGSAATAAQATAHLVGGSVLAYSINILNYTDSQRRYPVRPFAYVRDQPKGRTPATAQAVLNDGGQVVRVVHGPVPLWGDRRGQDVMMANALAFDLRVYDPGAPMFATVKRQGSPSTVPSELDVVITPSDPGWRGLPQNNGTDGAYLDGDNMGGSKGIYNAYGPRFQFVGQGAYVDMGYGFDPRYRVGSPASSLFPAPYYKDPSSAFSSAMDPWFFHPRGLTDVFGNLLAPGYAVYDTWSFHYENNGVNDDNDEIENGVWLIENNNNQGTPQVDEGTNGLDDFGHYADGTHLRLGADDVGERETTPPYDNPLRGMQVLVRTYERDSRAIRQVRVNQHFMQE